MKKITIILLITLILCLNVVLANTSELSNNYFEDEVFDTILFDYKYLTKNDDETCEMYYNQLKHGVEYENKEKIAVMTEEELKNQIILLQDNYESMKVYENKADLDLYILDLSLKYYSFEENREAILLKKELREKIKEIKEQEDMASETYSLNGDDVARLWICADPSTTEVPSSGYTGIETPFGHHSWLVVKNLTLTDITVGALQLLPNNKFSIGTWRTPLHYGIFYNLEGFYEDEMSNQTVSISAYIDATTLSVINHAFTDPGYDTWAVGYNCTDFAIEVWNYAVEEDFQISAGIINTPKTLKDNILDLGGTTVTELPTTTAVYYGGANPQLCYPGIDL